MAMDTKAGLHSVSVLSYAYVPTGTSLPASEEEYFRLTDVFQLGDLPMLPPTSTSQVNLENFKSDSTPIP
jgi:hypothetical protein